MYTGDWMRRGRGWIALVGGWPFQEDVHAGYEDNDAVASPTDKPINKLWLLHMLTSRSGWCYYFCTSLYVNFVISLKPPSPALAVYFFRISWLHNILSKRLQFVRSLLLSGKQLMVILISRQQKNRRRLCLWGDITVNDIIIPRPFLNVQQ